MLIADCHSVRPRAYHVDANLAEWLRPSSFSSRLGNNPRS